MFAERQEFFSSALWELSLLPRGKRRDDCLEELARGLGGHLRSVEHGTNAALRRVASQEQVDEVMHGYTAASSALARLLAHPASTDRLAGLRLAVDQMRIQEEFVVRILSERLSDTALLMVELQMEERFDDYVGVIGIHGVMSGAVILAESRQLAR